MKQIFTKFTIFAILGIFFSVYFSEIPHVDARAGHHSSSKDGGSGNIVLMAIVILYCAIYEIRRQKRLKILSRADQTKKSDFLIEKDKLNLLNKVSFNIIDLIFHVSSTSR